MIILKAVNKFAAFIFKVSKMTESEKYYHSLLRFGMKPGLERIGILLNELGNPQDKLEFVHVAGTNGKGSVCTFVSSVLCEAGYKTGLYTSPYVIDFRERIRVNGEMIPPDRLDSITNKVKSVVEKLGKDGIVITEFEAVTAAAFLYFEEEKCDIVVLETGLGGRFDATNVIKNPVCSLITSISLDHTKILGDTTEKIAFEKCGIIKKERTAVTSVLQETGVKRVISEQCKIKNSPLVFSDPSEFKIISEDITGTEVEFKNIKFKIPFCGGHQLDNAGISLKCIEILRENGYKISDTNIINGIEKSKNPARCEIISSSPLVILDGCHNDSSTKAFSECLKKYLPGKKIHALMGMMADKDCEKAIKNLAGCFDSLICVTPSNPRAMTGADLCKIGRKYIKNAVSFDSETDGVDELKNRINNGEIGVVCGSLYLAGDVREYLYSKRESNS